MPRVKFTRHLVEGLWNHPSRHQNWFGGGRDQAGACSIVVDPRDSDHLFVGISDEKRMAVGGALCVGRTEDGGQSWTELRDGLPQERCYDIVFRHALDVSGESLAFGSTTGNLFLSDNRGDSWQCLGNYFPPIYSVRSVARAKAIKRLILSIPTAMYSCYTREGEI